MPRLAWLAAGAATLAAAAGVWTSLHPMPRSGPPASAPASHDSGTAFPASEQALSARTRALEQLADRCVPELWREAETERDAAGRAQQQGDLADARARYTSARALYTRTAEQAAAVLARGACDVDARPTLPLPSDAGATRDPLDWGDPEERWDAPPRQARVERWGYAAGDPHPDDREPTRGASPEPVPTREPATAGRPRVVMDEDELALRTRAMELVESGRPCDAIELLQNQGVASRTRRLAKALLPACLRSRAQ